MANTPLPAPEEGLPDQTSKAKQCVITLAWYVRQYKVLSITNNTQLKPGMWLWPAYVEKLCQLNGWEVHIVDNDLTTILPQVLGGVASKVAMGGL